MPVRQIALLLGAMITVPLTEIMPQSQKFSYYRLLNVPVMFNESIFFIHKFSYIHNIIHHYKPVTGPSKRNCTSILK